MYVLGPDPLLTEPSGCECSKFKDPSIRETCYPGIGDPWIVCLTGRSCTGKIRFMKRKRPGRLGFWATDAENTGFPGRLERSAASARRAEASRRRSPASRGSRDPLTTSLPCAAPSLELTIAGQNVALGQEEQHAGQAADRPQRLGRNLHLAGARAHFRARRRGCGGAPKGACPGAARRRTAAGLCQRAAIVAPKLGGLSAASF